ncbi:hypothetical protein MPTK1_2g12840 [Marchantia polymorpha subsp. ruderalis]|uniref:Uncharacterized protein n=1 Tax=Marchantia polymorpha TaxID=3197 RepID=A0A2R6XAT2_MARPO|nr:hypothetical protein MARPO_0026s0088 [Marchantia polymorpha]BBN02105.1 hypothetical protein Mp_2g12840 [Marchantia polymorpha subsp. ruderalis]|eukprot:PTQ43215.1 hypothetical protein MARPO_0026s0088 [Marchantia polymorpha]
MSCTMSKSSLTVGSRDTVSGPRSMWISSMLPMPRALYSTVLVLCRERGRGREEERKKRKRKEENEALSAVESGRWSS